MEWKHVKDELPDTWAGPFTEIWAKTQMGTMHLAVLKESVCQKAAREWLGLRYGEAGMDYHVNDKANDFVYWRFKL